MSNPPESHIQMVLGWYAEADLGDAVHSVRIGGNPFGGGGGGGGGGFGGGGFGSGVGSQVREGCGLPAGFRPGPFLFGGLPANMANPKMSSSPFSTSGHWASGAGD